MTNTVFPTFQTQYISSISYQQAVAEHTGISQTSRFSSLNDVASVPEENTKL
jgi:hypothetical protein